MLGYQDSMFFDFLGFCTRSKGKMWPYYLDSVVCLTVCPSVTMLMNRGRFSQMILMYFYCHYSFIKGASIQQTWFIAVFLDNGTYGTVAGFVVSITYNNHSHYCISEKSSSFYNFYETINDFLSFSLPYFYENLPENERMENSIFLQSKRQKDF